MGERAHVYIGYTKKSPFTGSDLFIKCDNIGSYIVQLVLPMLLLQYKMNSKNLSFTSHLLEWDCHELEDKEVDGGSDCRKAPEKKAKAREENIRKATTPPHPQTLTALQTWWQRSQDYESSCALAARQQSPQSRWWWGLWSSSTKTGSNPILIEKSILVQTGPGWLKIPSEQKANFVQICGKPGSWLL